MILAIEWFAAGLGLLGVILGFQQRRLTWLAWLLSSVLYLGLTWHWALFGQSLVMAAFALVSVWGYVRWGQNVAVVVVPTRRVVMGSLGATAALTMGLVFWLESAGSVSPGLDASIAALSLLAMVWTARKHEACWLIWLVVNLLSVWLYSAQALWPTVGLYGVQAVLSGVGLMQWRAMHHTQETPAQMAT